MKRKSMSRRALAFHRCAHAAARVAHLSRAASVTAGTCLSDGGCSRKPLARGGNTLHFGPHVSRRPSVPVGELGVRTRGRTWQLITSWNLWGVNSTPGQTEPGLAQSLSLYSTEATTPSLRS